MLITDSLLLMSLYDYLLLFFGPQIFPSLHLWSSRKLTLCTVVQSFSMTEIAIKSSLGKGSRYFFKHFCEQVLFIRKCEVHKC